MKTNYKHIPKRERKQIQELMQVGKTNKEIAEELGRSRSTIGRELKRNCGYGARSYKHDRGQELADERRKTSKSPRISEKTWQKVFELFNLDLSPEQISGGAETARRFRESRDDLSQDLCGNPGGSIRELFEKRFP